MNPVEPRCDHAWVYQDCGDWQCSKCHEIRAGPPLGRAGHPEPPPPNSGPVLDTDALKGE